MPAPFTSDLAESLAEDVLARFQRYVRIHTEADAANCDHRPSSPGQLELGRLLVAELEEMGLTDVSQSENGYVFATLPGDGPTVGFLAHLDTSPDVTGAGVDPIVHRDYDGSVITLPRGAVLDPAEMPVLASRVGHDIVTASGDTLLGADDKAGMAAIMGAVAYLAAHPELPRTNVRVAFTPDEEIGRGGLDFDVEGFGARCAYTLDGDEVGEIQAETFAAKAATIVVTGVDIHPGSATGKMVNALRVISRIVAALPADQAPETTSEREGFIHPVKITGNAGRAQVDFILRDFDDDLLDGHVATLREIADRAGAETPGATVEMGDNDQYPNMGRFIEPYPEIVEFADEAIRREGVEPRHGVIRGGTDGSILSARGLPTPNLFAGMREVHSPREWVSVQDMAAAAAVVVRLAGVWSERG
jgi:tripeptide aminopeptidase